MLPDMERGVGPDHHLTRRVFLRLLLVSAYTGNLAAACTPSQSPSLPKPPYNPLIDARAIQDKYVGEILEIEDGFTGKSPVVGDPAVRRHTELVAGMFTEYYGTQSTADQLAGNILLIPTTEEFLRYLRQTGNLPRDVSEREVHGTVAQYTKEGAVVNLGHEVFNPNSVAKDIRSGLIPSAWNSLRELRITQTHEWGHKTQPNTDDPLLKLLDPKERYPNRRFSGFRLERFADISEGAYQADMATRVRYVELDEAAVELISAKPNFDLFPAGKDFYSSYPDFHGNPEGVSQMAKRLNRLRDATRMNPLILFNLHTNSEISEHFYQILRRSGLVPTDPSIVLLAVKTLINTVISGDPIGMKRYIDGALKYTPD